MTNKTDNSTKVQPVKDAPSEKIKIYYFYDATCGWCYGFRPVMKNIYSEYKDKFDLNIYSGGLRVDQRVPIGELKDYISVSSKRVEELCNVKFGDGFMKGSLLSDTMIMNSLAPAIALSIVKDVQPDSAFAFASSLQLAIYSDGLYPENYEGYGVYSEKIGLNAEIFVESMKSEKYLKLAREDFEFTKSSGVTGFPTVIALKDGTAIPLFSGYTSYEQLAKQLDDLLLED